MSDLLQLVVATPALLLFEVMDKEPPLIQTAILYGTLGFVGLLLSRKKWWWGLVVLPVVALFAWIDVGELYDPYVGPAIIFEAGYLHFLARHAFILSGFVLPVAAAVSKRRSLTRIVIS